MIYALIIAFGLILSVLLFAQLGNEVRKQNNQVREFFNKLALFVYYTPEEGQSDEETIASEAYGACKSYPIVSTSITCGRQGGREKHQLDLPVPTTDKTLVGTAAEFFIEPDAENLRLYVRLLEQESMWVCNADRSKAVFVVKDKEKYRKKEKNEDGSVGDTTDILDRQQGKKAQYVLPMPPAQIYKKGQTWNICTEKRLLQLGSRVLLGDTLVVVGYDRRAK